MMKLKDKKEISIQKEIVNKIMSLKNSNKFEDAISLCKSAIDTDPANAMWHIYLGDIYIEKHKDVYSVKQYVEEAITEYQRALENNAPADVAHYKMAIAFYLQGDLDKALRQINIALSHKDNDADYYYLKAKILVKKDALVEAYDLLKTSIKYSCCNNARAHFLAFFVSRILCKNFFVYSYHLCVSFLQLVTDKKAFKATKEKLSTYLKIYPTFLKGAYYEKIGEVDEAIVLYNDKIDKMPGFLGLYIVLGNAYKLKGKYEEAVNEYRMAIWHDPLNVQAYKCLCQLYEEIAEYDKAAETYKKLIKIQPRLPILYSNLGYIMYMMGEIDESIQYYQTAINLNPRNTWTGFVSHMLAHIHHESKQNFDAAISAYQNAQQLNPKDMEVYLNLGSAFYDKGDYANAQMVYRIALEIEPGNSRLHCNLAYLLWGKGEIEEAMKEYKLAIKYDPNYDIAYNNLGVLYLDDLGKVKEAIDCLEDAISANPNYALGYYNLGRAMVVCGDKMEAARLYQIALDINKITNEIDPMEIQDRLNNLFE